MAVIYLRHPNHGSKVAVSELEAQYDIENGWEEYDPADLVAVSESVAPESVNELQPRRRGRRPREATE